MGTTTQAAVTIQGSLTLDGMTESTFKEPSVKNAVESAIASAAGVNKSMVDVSAEQVRRRLGDSGRRLAGLMVTYTITTSSASQALSGLRQDAAAWTASINEQLEQSSSDIRVSVSAVGAPGVLKAPTTNTTGGDKKGGLVDAASVVGASITAYGTLAVALARVIALACSPSQIF